MLFDAALRQKKKNQLSSSPYYAEKIRFMIETYQNKGDNLE